jgi:hypothetical protein
MHWRYPYCYIFFIFYCSFRHLKVIGDLRRDNISMHTAPETRLHREFVKISRIFFYARHRSRVATKYIEKCTGLLVCHVFNALTQRETHA